jgi:DNA repair protein RadD
MLTLHEEQAELVPKLREAMALYRAILLYAACGFGKTVLLTHLIWLSRQKGKRIIFAVHRKELIRQTATTFDKFGLSYSYIAAGMPCNHTAHLYIASIPTLYKRLGKFPADWLLVDEAHLSMSRTWVSTVKHYRDLGAYILGCSASPIRLDGKGLRGNFEYLVKGPPPRYLMERGMLARYRLFVPTQPDVSGLHTLGGDYRTDEAEELMNKPSITGDCISHWLEHAKGKRTVAYCVSIEHSRAVAAAFRERGVAALHIDGETADEIRTGAFRDFADGKIDVITNCQLLTEGVDITALAGKHAPIKCVINLRPTQSIALWTQICGRAWRRDDEASIILDHAGVSLKLGLPDEDREWSLDGEEKEAKKKATSVKVCPQCWAAMRSEARKCPECSHAFAPKPREVEHREGELKEITPEEVARRQAKRSAAWEQSKAETVDSLVKLWRARGMKGNLEGRAKHVLAARAAKKSA